ncbi:MAG: Spy/CpxP family protein refolding chaperone [Gammaproteobacteria bacterium]
MTRLPKKPIAFTAAALLALVAATTLYPRYAASDGMRGFGGPHMMHRHGGQDGADFLADGPEGGMLMHMVQSLDLTREQRDRIGVITDAARPKMRSIMFDMMDQRKALHDAARAEQFDEAAIRKLADAHGRSMSEMIVLKARTRSQVDAVLTAEQRQKLAQSRDGMRKHHRRMFDRAMPPPADDPQM